MSYILRRHPFAVDAHLRRTLALTYAVPAPALEPLVAPGLTLDCFRGYGFLAIALVETEALRPGLRNVRFPAAFGMNFFLGGFRIFTRLRGAKSMRGLQILRSFTDRRIMAAAGNLFSRYNYGCCHATVKEDQGEIDFRMTTPRAEADLHVVARSGELVDRPFDDIKEARRFAGPMPYTFDYEPETQSIVRVRGSRGHWDPQPVNAVVSRNTFLDHEPFRGVGVTLAAAFTVRDVDYHWERGVREPLQHQ